MVHILACAKNSAVSLKPLRFLLNDTAESELFFVPTSGSF